MGSNKETKEKINNAFKDAVNKYKGSDEATIVNYPGLENIRRKDVITTLTLKAAGVLPTEKWKIICSDDFSPVFSDELDADKYMNGNLKNSSVNYANIMLLGRTGVGKSSFINYLVGQDVCVTGTGVPVTQGFNEYKNDDINGLPLRIYDSKGLEVLDYETIDRDIEQFVQSQSSSANVFDWIHSIFYCINVTSRRVEPEEINFIKRLSGKTSQTIHIVMTHCEKTPEGIEKSAAMEQYILSQLANENVRVYCVNSVQTRTRVGTYEPFGRDEILDQIFVLLWSDIARKIAKDYAVELRRGLLNVCSEFSTSAESALSKINTISVLSDLVNERDNWIESMGTELERCSDKIDTIEENLKDSYQKKIEPLVEFCNGYGKSFGYSIELYDPFDFLGYELFDMDIDGIMNDTKIGRMIEEMDAVEEDNIGELLKGLGKAISVLVNMKKLLKELFDSINYELRRRIPSTDEIEKSVYTALMKDIELE